MYNERRCLYGAVYYVLGSCKAFRSLLKENAFVAGVHPVEYSIMNAYIM